MKTSSPICLLLAAAISACVIGKTCAKLNKISEFHRVIGSALESEGVRGAAYAFRGPGMTSALLGAYGKIGQSDASGDIDLDTAFLLASISKTITGAAVGVMVDQGVIDLDDDICFATGYGKLEKTTACRNPEFPDTPVTWRMLVTHRTSMNRGTPNLPNGGDPTYAPSNNTNYGNPLVGNPTCPIDDIQAFYNDILVDTNGVITTTVGQADGPLDWYELVQEDMGGIWNATRQPGEAAVYSNIATSYIAALLPKVTKGTDFRAFCQEHIFDKIGMNTSTSWFRETLPNTTNVAMPIQSKDDNWDEVGHYCWANYADGQLYSSIRDMSLWAEAQLQYGIDLLWSNTTQTKLDGCLEKDVDGEHVDSEDCKFGLNWALPESSKEEYKAWSELNWTNALQHDGGEVGVNTDMLVLPEEDSYAIVLLNTEGANSAYFLAGIIEEGMGILLGQGSPGFFEGGNQTSGDDDDRNGPDNTPTKKTLDFNKAEKTKTLEVSLKLHFEFAHGKGSEPGTDAVMLLATNAIDFFKMVLLGDPTFQDTVVGLAMDDIDTTYSVNRPDKWVVDMKAKVEVDSSSPAKNSQAADVMANANLNHFVNHYVRKNRSGRRNVLFHVRSLNLRAVSTAG